MLNSALEELPKYTGQSQDIEVDLYYYGSRYYDAILGRFIQPDSIIPDAYSSQSLNPYAYVLNNPLRYTDPTGHYTDPREDDPTTSADNLVGDDPINQAYGDNESGTAVPPENIPLPEDNPASSGNNIGGSSVYVPEMWEMPKNVNIPQIPEDAPEWYKYVEYGLAGAPATALVAVGAGTAYIAAPSAYASVVTAAGTEKGQEAIKNTMEFISGYVPGGPAPSTPLDTAGWMAHEAQNWYKKDKTK